MDTAKRTPMTATTLNQALVPNNLPVPSALGSLDAYIAAVHPIPVLSVEDEPALAHRFRHEDDLGAARELVPSHLRFVGHAARGYNGNSPPRADLIQNGNRGRMIAANEYEP